MVPTCSNQNNKRMSNKKYSSRETLEKLRWLIFHKVYWLINTFLIVNMHTFCHVSNGHMPSPAGHGETAVYPLLYHGKNNLRGEC
jgi:hypothetical protein